MRRPQANRSAAADEVDRTWAVGGGGGETLYQDQPRGSIAGRTRPAGATVVRKWDEEQQAAPSHLFFRFAPIYSSIRCDDESLQDII